MPRKSGRAIGFVCVVLLLVPVVLGMQWIMREQTERRHLAEAKRNLERGDVAQALVLLKPLAAREAGQGEAAYLLGLCEQLEGNLDDALAAWERVPPESSSAGLALTRRAAVALERGAFDHGERFLLDALDRKGLHEAEAREMMVRLLRFQGRRSEAREWLRDELTGGTDPIRVVRDLWLLEAEAVPVDRTRAMFEEALRTHPDDVRVQLGLANLALRAGQIDEAGHGLDVCLQSRPDDLPTWRARLDWAIVAGDSGAARRALEFLPPDRIEPGELLELDAWFAAQDGDRDREREALRRLIEWVPGHPEALDRLAELAIEAGETEVAAGLRRRKAEVDQLRDQYGRRFHLKDHELALIAREMAGLAENLGRRDEAIGWWLAVIRREPGAIEAREALARLKESARVLAEEGVALADRLVATDPVSHDPLRERTPDTSVVDVVPTFEEEAKAAGLDFQFVADHSPAHHLPETMSGGVGMLDFDRDGWIDVFVPQGGDFPSGTGSGDGGDRLFRNRGDGTFEDVTVAAGFSPSGRGYGHGIAVGDFDNDGFPDLFLTRFDAYELWQNCGDGTFEDVTESTGLDIPAEWPTSAAWADLDGDGDLDLYVCHYVRWDEENPRSCVNEDTGQPTYCEPLLFEAVPDRLFRNDGDRFVDVTEDAGIVGRDGRGLGIVAADLDGNQLVDLYVANDMTGNFLYLNRGGLRFEEVGELAGVASNADGGYQAGMGIACGDLDGDGKPDLAVTNFYGEGTTFYRNLGGGFFADASTSIGMAPSRSLLGFGVAFLDANNDGALDLASANGMVNDSRPLYPYAMPTQLMLGSRGGRLTDVTERAGSPWTIPRVSRGLAVGDLDNDGRLDLLVLPQDGPLALFRNRTVGGHFVTFHLEGTTSSRDAIGTRIVVTNGDHRLVAWRHGGQSYQSAHDPRVHFGLGRSEGAVSVEVTWTSGHVDRFDDLPIDAGYLVREGEPRPVPLPGYGP
ncbi:FG-GAP-like repeat-containing protein [Tautonia marina]|uniref:FG-GAP-like repeat-containing protein n=1 Tax=Tautonia marina TaxID=2653855 RepID=UPI00137630B0|nr:FG-GAP-like repeat-containing protein [Tautonia marina]